MRYQQKVVKALRGTEARSVSKWQSQGWELVGQDSATLHTSLHFRKALPSVSKRQLMIGAGALAVLLAVAGIAAALEDGSPEAASVNKPASGITSVPTAAVELTESPTPAVPTPTRAGPPPQPPDAPDGPIVATTVDALYDRSNLGSRGGIAAGDRFRVTDQLMGAEHWSVGATGEYSVYLRAKNGTNDLIVFIDRGLTRGWRDGTKVEMVLKAVERTINGETTGGWFVVQSVKVLAL